MAICEWIECNGGECPVADQSVEVEVRYRNGLEEGETEANQWNWSHSPKEGGWEDDIIAYRIVTDE